MSQSVPPPTSLPGAPRADSANRSGPAGQGAGNLFAVVFAGLAVGPPVVSANGAQPLLSLGTARAADPAAGVNSPPTSPQAPSQMAAGGGLPAAWLAGGAATENESALEPNREREVGAASDVGALPPVSAAAIPPLVPAVGPVASNAGIGPSLVNGTAGAAATSSPALEGGVAPADETPPAAASGETQDRYQPGRSPPSAVAPLQARFQPDSNGDVRLAARDKTSPTSVRNRFGTEASLQAGSMAVTDRPGEKTPSASPMIGVAATSPHVPPALARDAGHLATDPTQGALLPAQPSGPPTFHVVPTAQMPVGIGNANAVSGASAPGNAPAAPVPLEGLAVEIATRAREGKRRFDIRLDPPELGRIDVRLDVGRDGQVTSRLVVERADTLDLLRRDAAALERTLQSAGLRTDESGLQFSLRDQSGGRWAGPDDAPRPNMLIVPDEDVAVREAVRRGYGVLRGLGRGIDISV